MKAALLLAILSIFKKLESSNHNAASFFVSVLETKAWTTIKSACISGTYIRVENTDRGFDLWWWQIRSNSDDQTRNAAAALLRKLYCTQL